MSIHSFNAELDIIGVNPFVYVPVEILEAIFKQAGKSKGHIPIRGTINGDAYKQTLVRYSGEWRLYINTGMLKNSPKRIGEQIHLTVQYDPESRAVAAPEAFITALDQNIAAKVVFESLPISRRLEIVRYLAKLKSAQALEINITRAINFLLHKERFIGRDKP